MFTEQDPLLEADEDPPNPQQDDELDQQLHTSSIRRAPLVAFLGTFGMTAAAASSVFVFAHIICKDSSACDSDERAAFSRLLAIATTIANVCAIVAIQPLNLISKNRPKGVLLLWLACRGSSVGLIWLAAKFKSIKIVVLSKILEGTATDNILQFALSTIYTRAQDSEQLSTLMAESMAFSLLGSSLGPLAAGLAPDFSSRIVISTCMFAVAAIYATFAIKVKPRTERVTKNSNSDEESAATFQGGGIGGLFNRLKYAASSKLSNLHIAPALALPAMALMLYTIGQAYVLAALMVYTSGHYGFTDRQNSWLLSLATATSASFIFLARYIQRRLWSDISPLLFNIIVAIIGMGALGVSLPMVMETTASGQIFLVASAMSLGLTSSSFIKTYGLLQLPHPEEGTAALAVFETLGSFLSPPVLGAAQTKLAEGRWTFVSTGMMAAAIVVLIVSRAIVRTR